MSVGVFAAESGFEPVDPCPVALVSLACLPDRLAAPPLHRPTRPRRPRLRELPLAYIRDPLALALVSELIALISDRITLAGHPVPLVRAKTSFFEVASQPLDAGSIRRTPFPLAVLFSHS